MSVTDYDAEQLALMLLYARSDALMASGRTRSSSTQKAESARIRSTCRNALQQLRSGEITPDMTDEQIARSIGGLLLWWFCKELLLFIAKYLAQQFWPDRPIGAAIK